MITTAAKESFSKIDRLAAEIVKASGASLPAPGSGRSLPEEIRFLEKSDYRIPLRKSLGRAEVREIIAEGRKTVWPHLNAESVRLVSPKEFTRFWRELGVQFQLVRLKGAEGLALLGFYVRKTGGSRLPLICVNTAHHPAAVGAAFSHEMGHHLIGRLFDSRKDHTQFLAYTFEEHLNEPEELAADILVSLGVFPEAVAREIFTNSNTAKPSKLAGEELPDSVAANVLNYFASRYDLNFGGPDASSAKLQYLAALVHFAKLRRAVLTEYDI